MELRVLGVHNLESADTRMEAHLIDGVLALDAGGLTREQLWDAYEEELARLRSVPRGKGGDFYLTQGARVSKRFARALVASTLEGRTLHRDALRMLGFSKLRTFHELGRSLGIDI